MELTSLAPIGGAMVLAVAVACATVLLWTRTGRWTVLTRTVGVLLCEVLVVLSIGLVVNRQAQFYPSWQALFGDTGTSTDTLRRGAGLLDQQIADNPAAAHTVTTLAWRPPESSAWRLSTPARIAVPAGYASHRSMVYPAVLLLGVKASAALQGAEDTVSIAVDPSPQSTAATLAGLPGALSQDVRVTDRGWALVTTPAYAPLAAQLAHRQQGRFTAMAVIGSALPASLTPGPALAVALVRPVGAPRPAPGVVAMTAAASQAWATATRWAVQQTTAPLGSPLVLPTAVA